MTVSPSAFRLMLAPLLTLSLVLAGCASGGNHPGKDKPAEKPAKHQAKGHRGGKAKTPTVGTRIPILSHIESGAKVDEALASIPVAVPPAEINPEWPQAGNTPAKSYGNLVLADRPALLWSAVIAGTDKRQRLAASPVIGGGQLFVMDTMGVVHGFDANTGAHLWSQQFQITANSATADNTVFGGGVSYDANDAGGHVYVTTGLGEIAALEAKSGKLLWKVKPAGPLRGAPTIAFDMVFAMTQNNELIALKASDGTRLWSETASNGQQGIFGVAAPTVGQGTVLAGFSTGELIAYRYENGRVLWSDALARTSLSTSVGVLTDIDADPIIDRGRVYALGQGGRMAAYELVTGQRIWEQNLAGISTPAVAGDWIFTLTDDAHLLCLSTASGKARWSVQLQRFHNDKKKKGAVVNWTGPVLAGGKLWLANTEGVVYSASIADGKLTPFRQTSFGVSLAPVVANHTLYVLDNGGRLSAFR